MASIDDRGKGTRLRWRARYRTPDGAQRTQCFARKVDADHFLATVETDKARGSWVDPLLAKTPFGDYASQWLETKRGLAPRSFVNVEGRLRNHVIPAFGRAEVGAIRPADVRAWVAAMSAKGLQPSTVKPAFQVLAQVLRMAEIDGLIPRSPCIGIELPKDRAREEMVFLSPQQVSELADAISPRYRALVLTAAYSGLRAGELEALRLTSVNVLRGSLEVVESLSELSDGTLSVGPTKTGKTRSVTVPRFVAEAIGRHVAEYPSGDGWVFSTRDGRPMRHRNFMRRHFRPAVVAAGLPERLRFHDLRHTHAALLIAQGAHPKQVQERLGHGSIRTTFDRYGHLFDGHDAELLDALDGVARSASDGSGVSRMCHGAVVELPGT